MTNTYYRKNPLNINDTYKVFFDAMQTNNIDEMAKAAEKVFALPIIIIDENDRPICKYPKEDLNYSFIDNYFKDKGYKSEIREKARIEALSDKPHVFDPFFLINGTPQKNESIFGQIYYDNKLYGYFSIFLLGNLLDEYDLERAKIFAKAISYVFHNQRSINISSLNSSLYDAINKKSTEHVRIQATETLYKNIKGKFIVLAKPIAKNANNSTYAIASLSHIKELKLNVAITVYDNSLIVLYGGIASKLTQKHRDNIAKIESFLKPAGFGCGISAIFDDLYEIQSFLEQARITALCSEKSIKYYEDIAPLPIFKFVSHYSTAKAFIDPVLYHMHEYDKKNNTDYFETLRVFSLFMHNRQQTITELCIHHNTLIYRLNRITELFGISYEEPQTALYLLNSFQLWDVLNK